jgi:ABC-2 type transport system ATP-binding protein
VKREDSLPSSIVEVRKLVKYYGKSDVPAHDGLYLTMTKGQIFTLLGRNGAGKTTFLRIATTQLLPTSGYVTVFGLNVLGDASAIRRRIAIAPQEGRPLWTLNAKDHIVLALMMRGVSHSEALNKSKRVLETLELTEVENVRSEDLSGGMKQRVLIAMAIACDAELIFLDEPTIGLDPVSRRKVWEELIRLKREEDRTIVLTTHYMDEAESLSDELAIIDRGRLLATGSPSEVREKHLDAKIRIDVANGFAAEELQAYGKVVRAGNLLRILTDEAKAQEISGEALRRRAAISISPVSLDDVFVELVGSDIDRDLPANNTAEAVKGGSIYER